MAVIVTCPNCDKKLKMNEVAPGKKVRCPACKEPFSPVAEPNKKSPAVAAPAKPKRKPQKPVEDEFDDYGYDDDYGDDGYDDEPAPPKRAAASGGKKSAAASKSKAAAGKKKGGASGKSKTPLFIGIGVLALGLAGGLTWMLLPSGDDTTPAAGNEGAENAQALAGVQNEGGQEAESPAEPAVAPKVDVSYLPLDSELVVRVDVERLFGGPLGQLLTMPPISDQVAQMSGNFGLTPNDIQSVTVGVGGISDAIERDAEPKPEELPGIAVIRTKVSIDATKIQSMIPRSQMVSAGSITYIQAPANPPVAIWVANPNTVVVGAEEWVKQVSSGNSSATTIDQQLFDGTSALQIAFSPKNPDRIFAGLNQGNLPPGPPASTEMIKTFLANARGASIGFDFTNDIAFSMAAKCKDSDGAQQMMNAMNAAQEESRATQDEQEVPPFMLPFMNIQKALQESTKIETDGDICRMSASATGAGQQIGAFLPMLPALIGPAIGQAQSAATRTQSKNNLKNIALAMHNFHDVHGRFPNAAPVDEQSGKKLLSWRVHLLRYLGHNDLYLKFAIDEPWDSPTNKALIDQMPDIYKSPKLSLANGMTVYQVPVGPGTAFEDGKGHAMREFSDGTSNTLLVLEVSRERAVVWTQPEDFTPNSSNPLAGLGGVEENGFQAAWTDGSTRFIPMSVPPETLKALFTRNRGEVVDQNF
ncbi:MAG: DUF1559 domain-containing protein [Fuerstiella sp.]